MKFATLQVKENKINDKSCNDLQENNKIIRQIENKWNDIFDTSIRILVGWIVEY